MSPCPASCIPCLVSFVLVSILAAPSPPPTYSLSLTASLWHEPGMESSPLSFPLVLHISIRFEICRGRKNWFPSNFVVCGLQMNLNCSVDCKEKEQKSNIYRWLNLGKLRLKGSNKNDWIIQQLQIRIDSAPVETRHVLFSQVVERVAALQLQQEWKIHWETLRWCHPDGSRGVHLWLCHPL